jgi:hypothetical protein
VERFFYRRLSCFSCGVTGAGTVGRDRAHECEATDIFLDPSDPAAREFGWACAAVLIAALLHRAGRLPRVAALLHRY